MINCIAVAIILAVTLSAALYLVREKRKGAACIGCPYSGKCAEGSCRSLDGVEIKAPR